MANDNKGHHVTRAPDVLRTSPDLDQSWPLANHQPVLPQATLLLILTFPAFCQKPGMRSGRRKHKAMAMGGHRRFFSLRPSEKMASSSACPLPTPFGISQLWSIVATPYGRHEGIGEWRKQTHEWTGSPDRHASTSSLATSTLPTQLLNSARTGTLLVDSFKSRFSGSTPEPTVDGISVSYATTAYIRVWQQQSSSSNADGILPPRRKPEIVRVYLVYRANNIASDFPSRNPQKPFICLTIGQ